MEYLKIWTNFREVMEPLSDAEKGRLFDAMLLYAETGEEPANFSGNERFLWAVAKRDIDRMAQKSETNRANGSKPKRTEAKVCEAEPIEANRPINKNNINININKDKEKEIKEKEKRFTPPTVDEVRAYCQEKGYNVDAETFVNFYASKGWKVGTTPMKNWKACLVTWSKRDNRASPPAKKVVAQEYSQRDYSDEQSDAMRRMLAGVIT